MFWLKCKTIIRPITKTKRKILQLRGFEVSKPYKTLIHKFICNMYNIACINTCIFWPKYVADFINSCVWTEYLCNFN
jgi:hypothetical protein